MKTLNDTSREDRDAVRWQPVPGSQEAREIDAVVSLLRSLPDPEPSSDLTARVIRRVMEIEAKPRVLRPAFGRFSDSRAAAVMAAGIACAAVGIGLQWMLGPNLPAVETSSQVSEASGGTSGRGAVAVQNQIAVASVYPNPRGASLFSSSSSEPALQVFSMAVPPTANIQDLRLDAQLNELQLDPQAFFRRLERVQERDRFVQRLAERAARRGDAAQVALNVRAVSHPLARPMVEQLLQASLLRRVAE